MNIIARGSSLEARGVGIANVDGMYSGGWIWREVKRGEVVRSGGNWGPNLKGIDRRLGSSRVLRPGNCAWLVVYRGMDQEGCDLLYSLHAKDDMPQELHDPSRRGIIQFRVDNPLPELDVVFPRAALHLVPRDGKLRTARRANLGRFLEVLLPRGLLLIRRGHVQRRRAGPLENIPPHLLGDVPIVAVVFLAARVPIAAEVDVAVLLDEVELEHAHGRDVVV